MPFLGPEALSSQNFFSTLSLGEGWLVKQMDWCLVGQIREMKKNSQERSSVKLI